MSHDKSKIGELVETESVLKDAIHVPIVAIEAEERLVPGAQVSVSYNRAKASQFGIGILDPFLRKPVEAGEKFWLFMHPNQVTNLSHSWEHPDIEGYATGYDDCRGCY